MSSRRRDEDDGPRVGDIVIVPFGRIREQIGAPEAGGLLMEDRRHVARVCFPTIDRTFWIDREHLEAVPPERLPSVHPLVDRLHRLARRVDAVALEIHEQAGDVGEYEVYTPAMSFEDLVWMRELLGDDLQGMSIEAGSVRRVRLRLRVRTLA